MLVFHQSAQCTPGISLVVALNEIGFCEQAGSARLVQESVDVLQ